jgi:cardiolipin synthase A/B
MNTLDAPKITNHIEQLFFSGYDYFKSLLDSINQAVHRIDLETYIFLQDSLGQKITEALRNAAQRNVKIRLLIDGAGTPNWDSTIAKQLEQHGIQNRVFHPFPWRSWQWSLSKIKAPFLKKFLYLLFHVNSRNHRKICIIDDKIAYIGSFNIRGNYFNTEPQETWRDTGVCLQNIDLASLNEAFLSAWHHFPFKNRLRSIPNGFRAINAESTIRLNNTRHRRRFLYKNLLRKIEFAKRRVWITNAYFVPDDFLLRRLKAAAQKGLDVRILLPKKADIYFMPWASSFFYQTLLKSGIRIFEYLPKLLHAKTVIIDDWMLVGSSNLNHRSLLHDLEVDVNVQTDKAKRILEQQFLDDLQHTEEIFLHTWQNRPLHQKIIGRLVLYLKHWL